MYEHGLRPVCDRLNVSWTRDKADIPYVVAGSCTLLATLTPPTESSFSVANLLILSISVSNYMPIFRDEQFECFYYGRAIWGAMKTAMGAESEQIHVEHEKMLDPLQRAINAGDDWRKDEILAQYGPSAVKRRYDADWANFEETTRGRKEARVGDRIILVYILTWSSRLQECERPLREAELRAEEERRAREEADTRAENERNEKEKLQVEIEEMRRQ